jgi:pyruvate formate lyase activating enzyme
MDMTRRGVLACGACAGAAAVCAAAWRIAGAAEAAPPASKATPSAREALYWEALDGKRVKCTLCPRECSVGDGGRGRCGVRENRGGKYYTLVYGCPAAVHVDPIEKKPLFHYLPGTTAFSVGTAGCNLKCAFCQNWNLSQFRPEELESVDLPPARLVEAAQAAGSASIAHTYNEPIVSAEYVLDTAKAGRAAGVPVVMISNGYIQARPMTDLVKELGAVKIDLKAFTDSYYAEMCGGKLQPVLDTLRLLKEQGVWFEIVILLVTGKNDSADEAKRLANWVVTELGPDVPLHFSRYFPAYKLQLPPTPVETMRRAWDAARGEGARFVYVGNVELPGKADTMCPGCGAVAVRRVGLMTVSNSLIDGKCAKCGRAIAGVWRKEDAFKRGALT